MSEYLSLIAIAVSLLSILLQFLYRKTDKNDDRITKLEDKVHKLSNKIQTNDTCTAVLAEKAESMRQSLNRIEDKLYE